MFNARLAALVAVLPDQVPAAQRGLKDRRLAKGNRPAWSVREFDSTFYVNPRQNRDFDGAFASRFMVGERCRYYLLVRHDLDHRLCIPESAEVRSSNGLAVRSLSDISVTGSRPGHPEFGVVVSDREVLGRVMFAIDPVRPVGGVGQRLKSVSTSGWDVDRPLVVSVEVKG